MKIEIYGLLHIHCKHFFMNAKSILWASYEITAWLIAWAPIGLILETKLKKVRSFTAMHRINSTRTLSWIHCTYPIPDMTWIFSALFSSVFWSRLAKSVIFKIKRWFDHCDFLAFFIYMYLFRLYIYRFRNVLTFYSILP